MVRPAGRFSFRLLLLLFIIRPQPAFQIAEGLAEIPRVERFGPLGSQFLAVAFQIDPRAVSEHRQVAMAFKKRLGLGDGVFFSG